MGYATACGLYSIVYAYLRGESVEEIQGSFPAVSEEEIHGALAFYLKNRKAIDGHLQEGKALYERQREAAISANPALHERLAQSRKAFSHR